MNTHPIDDRTPIGNGPSALATRAAFLSLATGVALAALPLGANAAKLDNSEIKNALETEFLVDDAVSLNNIDISVIDGVATLKGTTDNILEKERATRIAETVKGVRSVVNLVEVEPPTEVTGSTLQADVNTALFSDPATESYEINVKANDAGKVTLSGEVDSWQERNLAEKVAKGVRGVTSVSNQLSIEYKDERPDGEIQEDIEARLRWDTLVDDALIGVTVNNGMVTLRGTVGSAAEKRHARYDAWGVTGVKDVNAKKLQVKRFARDEDLRKDKYLSKPDSEIEDALKDAWLYDPRVLSFKITPTVDDGLVTLRGSVTNAKAKQAAEQVARHTVGVRRVMNFIKVRPDENRTEAEIKSSVLNALVVDPFVERYEIDVNVLGGIVYLHGTVDTVTEKLQAEDVASRVRGVTSVQNRLTVADSESSTFYDPYVWDYGWTYNPAYEPSIVLNGLDQEIKDDIEAQLFWSPFVDSDEVTVSVEDGVATLTGEVDTYNEKQAAAENAAEGGAIGINNDLVVK